MVGGARRVVHVDAADAGVPVVLGRAVPAGLVHVAQRGAVAADVDLLADQVVADVLAVVGVELDGGGEDVGGRLVQAAGLAAVDQPGGVRGQTVGHLVRGHVDRGERLGVVGAVAVRHAEAAVLPERVDVVVAVVDPRVRADAVAPDAGAAVHVLVVVPGEGGAVVGVGAGRLQVGRGAVAPGVVGAGEQRAGAGGAPVQVVRLVAAARGVGQRVRAARLGGAQRDLAAVHGVAGAVVDGLPLVELLAGGGVGDHVQLVGRAVVLEAPDDGLVRQDGLALGEPDDLAGRALGGRRLGALGAGGGDRLALGRGRGDVGGGVDVPQLRAGRLGDALGAARLVLRDHEVAAEDGQSGVGPLVARVGGSVAVLDHVADDQLLLGAEAQFPRLRGLLGVGRADQRGALGGGEVGGEGAGVGLRAGLEPGGRGAEAVGGGGRAGLDAHGEHGGRGDEGAGGGRATGWRGSHAELLCEGGTGAGWAHGACKQSWRSGVGRTGEEWHRTGVRVRSASKGWPEIVRCSKVRVR
ncbi:hypothetical protein BG846_04425 [Streptomyces fradiae ATCC 10745 = DSM 40063]|uniref:Uncharacterized protein n=1 Tax=Streptomyces fradiae ATCC 10745 = DSM 40063 TaxID=1319510 RepID=A0A1Y2NS94_STRFR|nr:hypothetical protein BG846_04425 [Streptomyces fradiae ATCC 10745 = DSM 40063]